MRAPQRRGTALFDGRHDLEPAETQVTCLFRSPRQPGAEDVRNLEGRAPHGGLKRSSASPTGLTTAQDVGGNLGIQGVVSSFVAKQNLDQANVDLLLQ